jgi:hypothetical protein
MKESVSEATPVEDSLREGAGRAIGAEMHADSRADAM